MNKINLVLNNHIDFWETLSKTSFVENIKSNALMQVSMTQKSRKTLGKQTLSFRTSLLNSIIELPNKNSTESELLNSLENYRRKGIKPVYWKSSSNNIFSDCLDVPQRYNLELKTKLLGIYALSKEFLQVDHPALPDELIIKRVETLHELYDWSDVIAKTYNMSTEEQDILFGIYSELMRNNEVENKFTHYLSYYKDAPVATSTLYCGTSSAGLYNRASLLKGISIKPSVATYYMPTLEFADALNRGYEFITSQTAEKVLKHCPHLGFSSCEEYELYFGQ